MKTRNELYFTVACLVLAYDYAWSNYALPSIVMAFIAISLAYYFARPSRKETLHLFVRSMSILSIEAIVFLFIFQETSTWLNPFLAGSTIVFCGCWSLVYQKSKIKVRNMFERFLTGTFLISICFLVIPLILFMNNSIMQYQITVFLVGMIMPIMLTLGIQVTKFKLSMTYSLRKRINV
ncbi:MAG: hypothetical protein RR674_01710 [Anaerorhabdus sp.]